MNFRKYTILVTSLLSSGCVLADSVIHLSSEVVVEQHLNKIEPKTFFFKNNVDDKKHIRIVNNTGAFPLIITLPDIKYSLVEKNGYGTLPSDGKDFIWIEPGSDVILDIKEGAKFYDFIPVVYMVGKKTPKVLAVISGKEISAARIAKFITYKDTPAIKELTEKDKLTDIPDLANVKKLGKGFYRIQTSRFVSMKSVNDVYIISRNNMQGGSQYYAKDLIAYPNEKILINVKGEVHVKK